MDASYLTDTETDELEAWLLAGAGAGNCSGVLALDGFATALVVGPVPGLPIRSLLDFAAAGCDRTYGSPESRLRMRRLVVRHHDALSQQFRSDADGFRPLFARRASSSGAAPGIEQWCGGFLHAIDLNRSEWLALFEDPLTNGLLVAATVFGNEKGRKQMAAAPLLAGKYRQIADRLTACTIAIYHYWRHRCSATCEPTLAATAAGPCPCGSGRPGEHCCGVTRTFH